MYNLLVGGAAGLGVDTTANILEKLLRRSGYCVFSTKDVMSRIRGGHNFVLIRFGPEPVRSHSLRLDGIVALDKETIVRHLGELGPDGFLLCDRSFEADDDRAIRIDITDMAGSLGNPRVAGSIVVGALLKIFGLDQRDTEVVLGQALPQSVLGINMKAIAAGYEAVDTRYAHQGGAFGHDMTITGNRAIALGAIAAGLGFYTAYPMSPATSILEYLAAKSELTGIVVEQAEDEIAAANMAIGASYAGARAMTGTSGGGFALMVEALGLSGMAEIPLVIVDVQRPGPVTGLPTRTEQSDLRFVTTASQGEFPRLVIALRHHEDAFRQTIRAFNLADKYQMPVILLSDQYLADSSATVAPFDTGPADLQLPVHDGAADDEYLRYRITASGISPRLLPGQSEHLVASDSDEHDERGRITEEADVRTSMMDKRMRKINQLEEELLEPAFMGPDSFNILLVGWGSTFGPIEEAIALLNAGTDADPGQGRFAALVFGDIYPLPARTLLAKAAQATAMINVEQNKTGQLAGLIREKTGLVCTGSILKYDGRQITGEEIAERVGGMM